MLINDCYNSNPRALDAMVDALMAMPGGRHIVVAEMLELGTEAEALHRECGRRMAERGVGMLVGVRGMAEAMVAGAREAGVEAVFAAGPDEAGKWIEANVHAGE